ncbi:MAG: hypothetical protein Q4F80_04700 [bacterium]|nr:hypothetical protein [bacterium]
MQNLNYVELVQHLEKSNGAIAKTRLKELTLMRYIFSSNYNSLIDYIEFTKKEENAIKIIRTGNYEYFEAFSNELTRHFFNFITSTKAYIDQTRRWVRAYYDETDIKQTYEKLIKEYIDKNELCKFVQDLRNYQTHYMIPITTYSACFSTFEPFEFKITIQKDKLLLFKEWKPLSLKYINSFDEDISVEKFCNDYYQIIENFYNKLFEKITNYHKEDFAQLELIREDLARRYSM